MQGKIVANLNSALPKELHKTPQVVERHVADSRHHDGTALTQQQDVPNHKQQLKIVVGANVPNAMILARADYEELSTI